MCSPSQEKLSKVEWLGLESRLKMTAGGWYHTRMFQESSDAAVGPLRAATHGSGSDFLVRDTIVQKSKLTTTQRTTCFARKGSWVYKGAHPGAEWDSQLRGAVNEQCTNRTEEL